MLIPQVPYFYSLFGIELSIFGLEMVVERLLVEVVVAEDVGTRRVESIAGEGREHIECSARYHF